MNSILGKVCNAAALAAQAAFLLSAPLAAFAGGHDSGEAPEDPPPVRLGERLFIDKRFSSPDCEPRFSCRVCHLVDEEKDKGGIRAYVDFEKRSKIPRRKEDHHEIEIRNSPTMLDCVEMPRLHMDGQFHSLEELSKTTLSGRNMGWIAGEEEKSFDNAFAVLLNDKGEADPPNLAEGSYAEQFKAAYNVDIAEMERDEAIGWIAKSMSDYMRSLRTTRDSPYDMFLQLNALPAAPEPGQTPSAYADALLGRVRGLEAEGKLAMPGEGFGSVELKGFRIFFRTHGPDRAGSCVECHTPPAFTDFSMHNTGVLQEEYDSLHGSGAFGKLAVPGPEAPRPSTAGLREIPSKEHPEYADLGYWNFADVGTSPLQKKGEADGAFLARMIGTFKTPTVRNLKFTGPYMHNGAVATVKEAVQQYIRVSMAAQAGEVRSGDERLRSITIDADDVAPLAAFLNSLNEKYE